MKRGFAVVPILVALTMCVSSADAQSPFDPPQLPEGTPDLQASG